MPQQTMEALSAMARYTQVVIAVSNPCQYYWGDIIEGRELLRAERRRAAREKSRSVSLDALPPEQLHAHAHPLLAAWGKLGRDFIRMLDGFDDADATRRQYSSLRLDFSAKVRAVHCCSKFRQQSAIYSLSVSMRVRR
jgi:exodeoxyribonuclease V gamma subunit